ncbi:MAG: J domain-containing protein [Planctomycetes bacterium]|nr:J domain-containing protein [Planctomycetota bacterium]
MSEDPFQVLGVARDASLEEIRAAYHRLARETHPDRNASADAARRFIAVHSAWIALRDGAAARQRPRREAPEGPTVRANPRANADRRSSSSSSTPPKTRKSARLLLAHERAALEAGATPSGCQVVRPPLRNFARSLAAALLLAGFATYRMAGLSVEAHRLDGPILLALSVALFATQLPALVATVTGRLAIWVGPGGVHEVRGRKLRSMTHEEIRAIEFGYDPIGRLGFHPFYLELLLGPEARPFRLRRPYGARELRRVIDLMLQHDSALG